MNRKCASGQVLDCIDDGCKGHGVARGKEELPDWGGTSHRDPDRYDTDDKL